MRVEGFLLAAMFVVFGNPLSRIQPQLDTQGLGLLLRIRQAIREQTVFVTHLHPKETTVADMKPGDFAAFPIQNSDLPGSFYPELGLTKREYMATQIAAGQGGRLTVRECVEMADALLGFLASTPKPGAEL